MPTTTDYVSSVSMLPTLEFLELVAKKQWDSDVSYGLGISTIVPMFHSTTNSEWLCLNTEAEFLEAPIGTISIKSPFGYTRPESSPVYVSFNDSVKIDKNKVNKAKSLFLFRIGEEQNEIITVSNYDKKDRNVTTAPPLDCFSRECLTWFSSDVDWFFGFGNMGSSFTELATSDSIVITDKSSDILFTVVNSSKIPPETIFADTPSETSPFVSVEIGTQVYYQASSPDYTNINSVFLFSVNDKNDSVVAFSSYYTSPKSSIDYEGLIIDVSWDSTEIIII